MDGREKVATFLLALDPKVAADLLSRFEQEDMADIVQSMLATQYVPDATVRGVLTQFGEQWGEEHDAVTEPRARVRSILENTLDADQVDAYLGQHDSGSAEGNPFAALDGLEAAQLASLLADEHSQTTAIVLSRVDPKKAGEVLAELPSEQAGDVVRRMMANEQETPPAVLQSLGAVLGERARTVAAGSDPWATPKGRCAAVAKVLSATTRAARDAALASVSEQDPDAGEQVRSEMFLFEDVALLGAQDMRKVVSAVDTQTLALALKTASDAIKEAVFKAISKRAAETMREEQEMLGPRPLSEVEGAQQVFVDTVLRLQEEGEITVRRGDEEELV